MTVRELPQVSDALRHEAVEIVRAAERTAREMTLCVDTVRDAQRIVRAARRLAERSADVIYTDAAGNQFQKVFRDDLTELKEALGGHGELQPGKDKE